LFINLLGETVWSPQTYGHFVFDTRSLFFSSPGCWLQHQN
jgi:hypothetical protein